jgi:hypothetical protein
VVEDFSPSRQSQAALFVEVASPENPAVNP